MKKFNMERIFKRSQKNKESYFGVELYAWPLMFFTTHDDTIEINILYESGGENFTAPAPPCI